MNIDSLEQFDAKVGPEGVVLTLEDRPILGTRHLMMGLRVLVLALPLALLVPVAFWLIYTLGYRDVVAGNVEWLSVVLGLFGGLVGGSFLAEKWAAVVAERIDPRPRSRFGTRCQLCVAHAGLHVGRQVIPWGDIREIDVTMTALEVRTFDGESIATGVRGHLWSELQLLRVVLDNELTQRNGSSPSPRLDPGLKALRRRASKS